MRDMGAWEEGQEFPLHLPLSRNPPLPPPGTQCHFQAPKPPLGPSRFDSQVQLLSPTPAYRHALSHLS